MKQNTAIPSIIEKFRKQRQRMKKFVIIAAVLITILVLAPLVAGMFPVLRNSSAWNGMMIAWGCSFGIVSLLLILASLSYQMCPACGRPIGEDFWSARYCQHRGTKLRED